MKELMVLMVLVMAMVFFAKANAPVVFKDMNTGQVCACGVDEYPASKEQCNKVDFESAYETVKIGECK